MKGKVYLVGAGPSDPGLFTIKGREVLSRAEVVVYDALVGPSILQMIPGNAEAINVGKRSSNHIMKQEDINELLAAKAKEGKTVVRLKGGDPFLFGRGGEELEVLVRDGIDFEVVPGIPSAISVPAYQGIPVTHRDYCSSLHIITGHKKAGKEYDIDFEALVRTKGTLVFLMGVAALGDICSSLVAAGMDPDTPAALLSRGTQACQRRIVATVSSLKEEVDKAGAITPAIIVVGEVCSLAEDFAWYEKQPLGGVKVLLTRPKELISETARELRSRGADVVEFPAIKTVKIENNEELYKAMESADQFGWIVFTSPTGVRIFFEDLAEKQIDCRKLGNIKIAAIGGGTKKELAARGYYADLMPEIADGDHLGIALAEECRKTPGVKVLIPRARIGNKELTEHLQAAGAEIFDIPTYDTVYARGEIVDEKKLVEDGEIDYCLFTSASTVKGFAEAIGQTDYSKIKAICIGKQTEEQAAKLGMQTWTAAKPSIKELIAKLEKVHGGINS